MDLGSEIRDPEKTIPDPGVKKTPDTGVKKHRIRIATLPYTSVSEPYLLF